MRCTCLWLLAAAALLLLAVVPSTQGLKCYTCTNCGDDSAEEDMQLLSCDSLAGIAGSDACGKTTAPDGKVIRNCMSRRLCLGGTDACANSDGTEICCCKGDGCNGAGSVRALLLPSLAVAVAMLVRALTA